MEEGYWGEAQSTEKRKNIYEMVRVDPYQRRQLYGIRGNSWEYFIPKNKIRKYEEMLCIIYWRPLGWGAADVPGVSGRNTNRYEAKRITGMAAHFILQSSNHCSLRFSSPVASRTCGGGRGKRRPVWLNLQNHAHSSDFKSFAVPARRHGREVPMRPRRAR